MTTSGAIFRTFAAALAAGLAFGALAAPAQAEDWPPDERIKIALEPTPAMVGENGEITLGVSIWVDEGAPLTIRGAAATIGDRTEIVRRTKFWDLDLIYDVDEVVAEPGGWTRLTGEAGGIIISGVRPQDLERPAYFLFLDCGDAGMRTVAVPLADLAQLELGATR